MKLDSFANRFGKTKVGSSAKQRKRITGQSLVELALLLPVLMLVLIGTLDLGRLVDAYIVMTNAAREGARYGMNNPTSTNGIRDTARAEAANSGYQTAQMTVTAKCQNNSNPPADIACTNINAYTSVVSVRYPFTLVTTYIFGATNIWVQTQSQMIILK